MRYIDPVIGTFGPNYYSVSVNLKDDILKDADTIVDGLEFIKFCTEWLVQKIVRFASTSKIYTNNNQRTFFDFEWKDKELWILWLWAWDGFSNTIEEACGCPEIWWWQTKSISFHLDGTTNSPPNGNPQWHFHQHDLPEPVLHLEIHQYQQSLSKHSGITFKNPVCLF